MKLGGDIILKMNNINSSIMKIENHDNGEIFYIKLSGDKISLLDNNREAVATLIQDSNGLLRLEGNLCNVFKILAKLGGLL